MVFLQYYNPSTKDRHFKHGQSAWNTWHPQRGGEKAWFHMGHADIWVVSSNRGVDISKISWWRFGWDSLTESWDMWRVSFEFLGIRVWLFCTSSFLWIETLSESNPSHFSSAKNVVEMDFYPMTSEKRTIVFFFHLTEVSSFEDLFHHSEDFYELHCVDRWIDELAFFPMGDMSPRSVVSIVETDATVSEASGRGEWEDESNLETGCSLFLLLFHVFFWTQELYNFMI